MGFGVFPRSSTASSDAIQGRPSVDEWAALAVAALLARCLRAVAITRAAEALGR